MKLRLDHAPLAQVDLALAGEQAVAQQHAGTFQGPPFFKVALVGDQHLAHEVGVAHEIHIFLADPQAHHVSQFTGGAGKAA